jgi:hypothetical protein
MPKKTPFTKLIVLLILLNPTYAENISFEFTNLTKSDGAVSNTNWVEINSTLEGEDVQEIIFNGLAFEGIGPSDNGTNYIVYDESLALAMNFDNDPAIGENSTEAVDISRYGNNGTIYGATQIFSGKYGGAIEFDGVDDYVAIPPLFKNQQPEMTLSVWFYANNITNNGVILMERDISTRASIILYVYSGRMYASVNDNSSNVATKYVPIIPNQWYFGAVTYRSGKMSVYLNGSLVGTAANVKYSLNVQNNNFSVGGWPVENKNYFNGSIDDIRVYNRTLSPEEIKMLYQSNLRKVNDTAWEFYANLTNLADGDYSYYIWAKDGSGNISQSPLRRFSVEATCPFVKIKSISLESGSGRPILAIKVEATDANLNYTRISATNSTGGVLNSTESRENGSYTAELLVPFESQYIITASAYDNAGNTNQSTIIYNVDAAASSQYFLNVISNKPALTLGGFVMTVGIAFLIIIFLIIALWKHNRKGRKPKKDKVIMLDYKGN